MSENSFRNVNVNWDVSDFERHVSNVLLTLQPLEAQFTKLQLVALLQYATGLYMAHAGLVFPEHPLHAQLTSLANGYATGVEMFQRTEAKRELQQ